MIPPGWRIAVGCGKAGARVVAARLDFLGTENWSP